MGDYKYVYGCGCWVECNDAIRKDCHFYHCEHEMGASIDCCLLGKGLGDCPCTPDCKNYISEDEIKDVIRKYINDKLRKEK